MSEKRESELAPWEGAVEDMRERMIFLLQDVSPNRGRYAYLEEKTAISAARWQNLFLRRLYPSMDMVYAAISLKRAYREWLIDGPLSLEPSEKQPEHDRWVQFVEFRRKEIEKQQHLEEGKKSKKTYGAEKQAKQA
jgi:hypothetical protein